MNTPIYDQLERDQAKRPIPGWVLLLALTGVAFCILVVLS